MAPPRPVGIRNLTIRYSGITHRIITELHVAPVELSPPNGGVALPDKAYKTTALWDTGASGSCVTPAVATALGLVAIGQQRMTHAGGQTLSNLYLVDLYLPNNVVMRAVQVLELADQPFGAIIGMNIITAGDMALTNHDGHTVFSFRWPSTEIIDFTNESLRGRFSGVGRNDPCPCGSTFPDGRRKKFKECHQLGIR